MPVDGYQLPVFPLSNGRILAGNGSEMSLQRRNASFDNGQPTATVTGTLNSEPQTWSFVCNYADTETLKRFITKEYYFVQTRSGVLVDPQLPNVPDNIDDMQVIDERILQRGLNQGISVFQRFDKCDGVWKRYRLLENPSYKFTNMNNHENSFQLQFQEIGVVDAKLSIFLQNPSAACIIPDIPVANPDIYTESSVVLYYKDDEFMVMDGVSGETITVYVKPSSEYVALFGGIYYPITDINISGGVYNFSLELPGVEGYNCRVTNAIGDDVVDADISATFSTSAYDFDSINDTHFNYYVAALFPYTIQSNEYNISKTINSSGEQPCQLSFVIPFGNFVVNDYLSNPIAGVDFNSDVTGDVSDGNMRAGVLHNVTPQSFNLPSKSDTWAEGDTKALIWIAPYLNVTWPDAFGRDITTELSVDGEVIFTGINHSFNANYGAGTISLEEFGLSQGVSLTEGEVDAVAFTIPAAKLTAIDLNGDIGYNDLTIKREGVDLTYGVNQTYSTEALDAIVSYSVSSSLGELISDSHTFSVGNEDFDREFEIPQIHLKSGAREGTNLNFDSDNAIADTGGVVNNLVTEYVLNAAVTYDVKVNGVTWYSGTTTANDGDLYFYVPVGSNVDVNVEGDIKNFFSVIEGQTYLADYSS